MKILIAMILVSCTLACTSNDYGKVVTDKGHKLYYMEPVTESEAKDVMDWLHEINHNFGEPAVPFQLSKDGNKYVFKYPVQIPENIEGSEGFMQTFAQKLSERLKGAPVDVVLTDDKLEKNHRIISAGK